MAHDIVSEVYKGKAHSARSRETLRNRIDWMIGLARGPRILDLGCSQGIVSILLARAGHEVVGVDSDPEAIAYAQKDLTAEPEDVRARLRFRAADIPAADFDEDGFDTVILGEVIEHLRDPEPLIRFAHGRLKEGGTLILTTPFGIHPHPDHHQTFYLSNFASLVAPYFSRQYLEVVDKNILFHGVRRTDPVLPGFTDGYETTALLALSEKAFHQAEESYIADIEERREKAQEHRQVVVEMQEARKKLLEEKRTVDQELNQSLNDLKRTKQLLAAQGKQLESMRQDLDVANEKVKTLRLRIKGIYGSGTYQLGYAVSRAARPSLDTLKLPYRLWRIGGRAIRRRGGLRGGGRGGAAGRPVTAAAKQSLRTWREEFNTLLGSIFDKTRLDTEQLGLLEKHVGNMVGVLADTLGIEEAEKWLTDQMEKYPSHKELLASSFFNATSKSHPKDAIKYGRKAVRFGQDPAMVRKFVAFCRKQGEFSPAIDILNEAPIPAAIRKQIEVMQGQEDLLQNGFSLPEPDPSLSYQPDDRKIFYILHTSLPYISNGYSTRAHAVLGSVRENGYDAVGLTRFGFPIDLNKFKFESPDKTSEIDGVTYFHFPDGVNGLNMIPPRDYFTRYGEEVIRMARDRRPALIHAASNYINGLTGCAVAARLGLPSIYEVRGLWEITRISREPEWAESQEFALNVRLETEAAQKATAVIAITEALKDELVRRGVDEDKITVVPNGVAVNRFQPRPRDQALAGKLGLKDETVIGYIGSMVDYEGLDLLVEAAAALKAKGRRDFRILFVGDGGAYNSLRTQCFARDVEDRVIFTGRVPHEEVESYYSLVDIAPFPRKGLPVCEMVSPLKPFEAMAMGKTVVSSDVAALTEIVSDGQTGLLHRKDDAKHLASILETLLDNRELATNLAENAREWVIRERDWSALGRKITGIYDALIAGHR